MAFPIDFDRRPYNTLALPCECVIINATSPTIAPITFGVSLRIELQLKSGAKPNV